MYKNDRELKEMTNLFADSRFVRQAWRSVGMAIANSPAQRMDTLVDKNGEPTSDSLIEQYSYKRLCNDLKQLGKPDREPTELELILQCQMVKARYDTSAATFIRDTLGAKPVDESKMDMQVNNPYEQLTDEELDMLAAHRAALASASPCRQESDDTAAEPPAISHLVDTAGDNDGKDT